MKHVSTDMLVELWNHGSDWLGLWGIRLHAGPGVWCTYRGVKLARFTFLVKLPAGLENWLASKGLVR